MRYPHWSAALVLLAAAASAQAQQHALSFAKAQDAVAYRKGAFFMMERHFSRLNAMAFGRLPFDAAAAARDADAVALLAALPFAAFVPESQQAGDTRANAFVWKAAPRFAQEAQNFIQKAAALPAAARSGDLAALKAATLQTASSCRQCHERFRVR